MGAAASATARHSDPREVRVPPGPLGVRFRHTPGIGPRVAEVPADYSFSLLCVGEHVLRLDGADVSSLSSAEFCDRMKACAERSRGAPPICRGVETVAARLQHGRRGALASLRGNRLPSTTCLTRVFSKSGE